MISSQHGVTGFMATAGVPTSLQDGLKKLGSLPPDQRREVSELMSPDTQFLEAIVNNLEGSILNALGQTAATIMANADRIGRALSVELCARRAA